MKIYKAISAALSALLMSVIGSVYAGAVSIQPVAANENKATVWIFAGIIGVAAVGGIIYYIISNKKK